MNGKEREGGNGYEGFTLDISTRLESIDPSKTTPEEFFRNYISRRKPVVIQHFPDDVQEVETRWTNEYLKSRIGNEVVEVEKRSKSSESFGQGKVVRMTFSELLEQIEKGNQDLYLTTQGQNESLEADQNIAGLEEEEEGADVFAPPRLMPAFLEQLAAEGDFPLKLKLASTMIPANLNVWFGNTSDGSSSGLHHDFHDNFYLLLRGKKRFRLVPPSEAEKMKTTGMIQKVYPNGRIVYAEGHELDGEAITFPRSDDEVNEDGSLSCDVHRWQLEERISANQAKLDSLTGTNAEEHSAERKTLDAELEELEDQLAEAKSNVLLAMMECGTDTGSISESEQVSDNPSTEPLQKKAKHCEDGTTEEMQDSKLPSRPPTPKPDHFCNVEDTSLYLEEEQIPYVDVELTAGSVLYLPAGWFHEVRSFSVPTSDLSQRPGHLAFNYWFHPPDSTVYLEPYRVGYWQHVFSQQQQILEQRKKSSLAPSRPSGSL